MLEFKHMSPNPFNFQPFDIYSQASLHVLVFDEDTDKRESNSLSRRRR